MEARQGRNVGLLLTRPGMAFLQVHVGLRDEQDVEKEERNTVCGLGCRQGGSWGPRSGQVEL